MTADPTTTPISFASLCAAWTNLPAEDRPRFLLSLPRPWGERFARTWHWFSHEHQRAPENKDWTTWLILGGRGAGKTRAGAEWVREQARDGAARIALIGETTRDVRDVMVEGVSGLLAVHETHERPE